MSYQSLAMYPPSPRKKVPLIWSRWCKFPVWMGEGDLFMIWTWLHQHVLPVLCRGEVGSFNDYGGSDLFEPPGDRNGLQNAQSIYESFPCESVIPHEGGSREERERAELRLGGGREQAESKLPLNSGSRLCGPWGLPPQSIKAQEAPAASAEQRPRRAGSSASIRVSGAAPAGVPSDCTGTWQGRRAHLSQTPAKTCSTRYLI